jgi:hypothetical protein
MAADDAQWFHRLVDEFGRRKGLKAVIVQDGPSAFKVQYGKKADGEPLYELSVDFVNPSEALAARAPAVARVHRRRAHVRRQSAHGRRAHRVAQRRAHGRSSWQEGLVEEAGRRATEYRDPCDRFSVDSCARAR